MTKTVYLDRRPKQNHRRCQAWAPSVIFYPLAPIRDIGAGAHWQGQGSGGATQQPDIAALSFEERLALMVDRAAIERGRKRLVSRLKFASLRQSLNVEAADMKAPHGLDKALFAKLAAGDPPKWIGPHYRWLEAGRPRF